MLSAGVFAKGQVTVPGLEKRPGDPLGRAYNRTSHLAERMTMQRRAEYLDSPKQVAQVVPLKTSVE